MRVHFDRHFLIDEKVRKNLKPPEAHEVLHSLVVHTQVV
jgi:hypothetical protein